MKRELKLDDLCSTKSAIPTPLSEIAFLYITKQGNVQPQ